MMYKLRIWVMFFHWHSLRCANGRINSSITLTHMSGQDKQESNFLLKISASLLSEALVSCFRQHLSATRKIQQQQRPAFLKLLIIIRYLSLIQSAFLFTERTTSGLTMDGGGAVEAHFISELRNLEHDIERGFPSSSGQEQGPVTDLMYSDDLIYSVPTDMVKMANKERQHVFEKERPFNLFSPCIVSIGPLNFNPSSSSLMGNEIKKEALRKMLKDHAHVTSQTPGFVTALIRRIEEREKEIKECYADSAKIAAYLSGSTFAGIMLLDSCFLLQVIYLIAYNGNVNKDEWPRLATVFEDRHMKAMVIQDIFKIGNQIPLFVVQEVAKAFQKSFEREIVETLIIICPLCSYPPVRVLVDQVGTLCSSEKPHLLSLLHRFMCGSLTREMRDRTLKQETISDELTATVRECFRGDLCADLWTEAWEQTSCCEVDESANVLSREAWIFLRGIGTCAGLAFILVTFVLCSVLAIVTVTLGLVVVILLLPFFIMACLWPQHRIKKEEASSPWLRVKAENLAHHISIKSYWGKIKDIRYEPSHNSSLYLPCINAGETSGVVLHNMIAMERCWQRVDKKTVCNYAILMAKLLQTPTDVQVLEDNDVLVWMDEDTNVLRGMQVGVQVLEDHDVLVWLDKDRNVLRGMRKDRSWTVSMFQDLQESAAAAELRFSDWTDGCLKTLRQLQQEELPKLPRWKGITKSMMFWVKDLGRRYAANPWVALSTAAAAILLLMTGAQVVCLFHDCNSSSRKS